MLCFCLIYYYKAFVDLLVPYSYIAAKYKYFSADISRKVTVYLYNEFFVMAKKIIKENCHFLFKIN